VVLQLSAGKPIDSWPTREYHIQPTVLLAILSATANTLLRYAFFEGYTIAWWLKALRGGTIDDLHRYWEHGTSLRKSITSGRRFNLVSLATLVTAIVVIDGPLLQRASSVSQELRVFPRVLSVSLSPDRLPLGWTGTHTGHGGNIMVTPQFSELVMRGYNNRTPIRLNYTGCSGVCSTTLLAPGFDINCTTSYKPYNINPYNTGTQYSVGNTTVSFDVPAYSGLGSISTSYLSDPRCVGNLTLQTCDFRLAQVKYYVTLTNETVSLNSNNSIRNSTNHTTQLWDLGMESYGLGTWPSTLGGIFRLAEQKFTSHAYLYADGTPFSLFFDGDFPIVNLRQNLSSMTNCSLGMAWLDSTPSILSGMQELIFRSAIAASNSSAKQTPAGQTMDEVVIAVYASNFRYLAAAFAVMVSSAMLVLPVYIGWGQLGREVSLSPIETAMAFGAPVLSGGTGRGEGGNGDVKTLVETMGGVKVRYGEVAERMGNEGEEGESVELGVLEDETNRERLRLRIERVGVVRKPRGGVEYVG
jgi:Protein of unknown function (DUF3176)